MFPTAGQHNCQAAPLGDIISGITKDTCQEWLVSDFEPSNKTHHELSFNQFTDIRAYTVQDA